MHYAKSIALLAAATRFSFGSPVGSSTSEVQLDRRELRETTVYGDNKDNHLFYQSYSIQDDLWKISLHGGDICDAQVLSYQPADLSQPFVLGTIASLNQTLSIVDNARMINMTINDWGAQEKKLLEASEICGVSTYHRTGRNLVQVDRAALGQLALRIVFATTAVYATYQLCKLLQPA